MRLINADSVLQCSYSETDCTGDMIENWIAEAGFDYEAQIEYEEELKKLCKLVIRGMRNVVDTEPTAYDVNKVLSQLQCEECEKCLLANHCSGNSFVGDFLECIRGIVKAGGVNE